MKSKKKNGCFKILMIIFIAFICMVALWSLFNFRPGPAPGRSVVTPSPETTVLVSPLDENGDVDYVAALNEANSKGVTPENNSLVKILQALGPMSDGQLKFPKEFFEKLGMEPLPEQGNYFVDVIPWLESQGFKKGEPQFDDPYSSWESAQFGSWDPAKHSVLEQWFQQNEYAMESVREGVKRSRYFSPIVLQNSNRLIDMDLGIVQELRMLNRNLRISAMRHLALDEPVKSLEDVLDMYRLGSHVGQGSSIIESLIAIAICGTANDAAKEVFASRKASSGELLSFSKKLDQIPLIAKLEARLKTSERYLLLDTITGMGRGETYLLDNLSGGRANRENNSVASIALSTVDFNETFLVVNDWYDKLIAACEIEDDIERLKAFDEFEEERMQMERNFPTVGNAFATLVGGRKIKGQTFARLLVGMFIPAIRQVAHAGIRYKASLRMTKIAAAAAAYEADNGEYPKTMDLLVPKYLVKIPLDPFSNADFKYKPLAKGIFIYSVYVNGTDDGGSDDMQNGDWPFYWGVETGSEEAKVLQNFEDDYPDEEEMSREKNFDFETEKPESEPENDNAPLAGAGK